MRTGAILRAIGSTFMILGLIGLIVSIIVDQIDIFLLFIIPVIQLNGIIPAVSILLTFIGSLLVFISISISASKMEVLEEGSSEGIGPKNGKVEWGGVILLGPIPIIFGSTFSGLSFKIKIAYLVSLSISLIILLSLLLFLIFGK